MAETPDTPADGSKPAAAKTAKPKAAKKTAPASGPGDTDTQPPHSKVARARFSAAIEEARAGVSALRSEALAKGSAYRQTASASTADWVDEAKAMGEQARQRAAQLANDGKTRASDGLAALGKTVSNTAETIDEKLGKPYGDYARSAARTMQEAAARLDAKDLSELGDDARTFIKEKPAAAIGMAAVAGFFFARMFRGRSDD